VIRCLLCGWRFQALRPHPPIRRHQIEIDDEEDGFEMLLNFASEPLLVHNQYMGMDFS
jgi:hypothetical protein